MSGRVSSTAFTRLTLTDFRSYATAELVLDGREVPLLRAAAGARSLHGGTSIPHQRYQTG